MARHTYSPGHRGSGHGPSLGRKLTGGHGAENSSGTGTEVALEGLVRLIAIPGDTVEMVEKQLYVNGTAVADAEYTIHRDPHVGRNRPGGVLKRDEGSPSSKSRGRAGSRSR